MREVGSPRQGGRDRQPGLLWKPEAFVAAEPLPTYVYTLTSERGREREGEKHQ